MERGEIAFCQDGPLAMQIEGYFVTAHIVEFRSKFRRLPPFKFPNTG